MNNHIYKIIMILLLIPVMLPLLYIFLAQETRVCGIDGKTYPSKKSLEKFGIEMSYDFPCQEIDDEKSLYERKENINLTGAFLDYRINYDEDSVYLVLKENSSGLNYFVVFDGIESSKIGKYVAGDQLRVRGELNKNTLVVEARELSNLSTDSTLDTFDCLVTGVFYKNGVINCSPADTKSFFEISTSTKIIMYGKDITLYDLSAGDLLRVRGDDVNTQLVIKQRDGELYLAKERASIVEGKVLDWDSWGTILLENKNNEEKIIKTNHNTRIVKKYFGLLKFDQIKVGDDLMVVGVEQDDQTITAMTIKDNSIWK